MPFGIVAYALMLFSWTTFLETAVYRKLIKKRFPSFSAELAAGPDQLIECVILKGWKWCTLF